VRILSVGCSSGEELYSLAILLRERGLLGPERVVLRGMDLNPGAIRAARRARYDAWALRGLCPARRDRWFERHGDEYRLVEEIRAAASFEERNLFAPDLARWLPGSVDVLLCRNVMIYFSERAMRRAIACFTEALVPGGFLFLGASETLRGVSDAYEVAFAKDACYYRRRREPVSRPARLTPRTEEALQPPFVPARVGGEAAHPGRAPLERVGRGSDGAGEALWSARPEAGAERALLGPLLDLFEAERFDAALAHIAALPAREATRPGVQLARAAALTTCGRLGEAEHVCAELLMKEGYAAKVHFLLGLCHEAGGDPGAALRHYREATLRDPGFAMGHLHLGLLAGRRGDTVTERMALRVAASQLPYERRDRLLLFGGGFGRGALIEMARARLCALGEVH
jgi:chemotaxis protein methyltransferase CheR